MIGYEIESKFELNEADFKHLLSQGISHEMIDQLNIYYDCDNELSSKSATFRVRCVPQGKPIMTLKVPVSNCTGTRKSLEVEQALEGKMIKFLRKEWDIARDLPEEFSTHLKSFEINKLKRIGWMRNCRWMVKINNELTLELDQVKLPNGKVFFEVEVENNDLHVHTLALKVINQFTKSARPSTLSKYERFLQALSISLVK